jgi:hypothetical protein
VGKDYYPSGISAGPIYFNFESISKHCGKRKTLGFRTLKVTEEEK